MPGQKVRLHLEIAVDTWFTGGTRISIPEVPGLVILQNEQFAANASESRDGATWVIQRWTLDLFPQRAGSFEVPPIRLNLKVNGGSAGNVKGQVFAPPTSFEATLPAALEQAEQWVAAPAFSARQQLDREPGALRVGDAFERRIDLEAADIMAMMLPALQATSVEGLASYTEPPMLDNSSNRGEMKATRSQVISYIAEAPGDYILPAMEFLWWDTGSAQLQVVELPAVEVTVTGSGAAAAGKRAPLLSPRQLLAAAAALLALLLTAWLGRTLLPRLPWSPMRRSLTTAVEFIAALRRPALPPSLNPGNSAGD